MRPTIFLNLDGTCHPRTMQYAVLRGYPHVGPTHFCWAESLKPVLEAWDAEVVIRSSATMMFGLEPVAGLAPEWLRSRIVGKCDDVARYIALFDLRKVDTAFNVVRKYVRQHQLKHWAVLSDDEDGWPPEESERRHLVQCDPAVGLSDPVVAQRLGLSLAETQP